MAFKEHKHKYQSWYPVYEDLVSDWQRYGLWDKNGVLKHYTTMIVQNLVKNVYNRFVSAGYDPNAVSWDKVFEDLQAYTSPTVFIQAKEAKGLIPRLKPEEEAKSAKELEQQIEAQEDFAQEQNVQGALDFLSQNPENKKAVEYLQTSFTKLKAGLQTAGQQGDEEAQRRDRAQLKQLQAQVQELKKRDEESKKRLARARELEEAINKQPTAVIVTTASKVISTTSIRFTAYTSPFKGADNKVYGPFNAGQVATVPSQDAEKLVKSGVAQSSMSPQQTVQKDQLTQEARTLWEEYRNAVLNNDVDVQSSSLRRLKQIRIQLYPAK